MQPSLYSNERRTVRLVVFRIGGDEFALPVDVVQEVVRYAAPRRIASDDPSMLGVVSLRGTVLPVCDLASRLGVPAAATPERLLISMPGPDRGSIAFAVDGVDSIERIEVGALHGDAGRYDSAVAGVAHVGDRVILVLDPVALLSRATPEGPPKETTR